MMGILADHCCVRAEGKGDTSPPTAPAHLENLYSVLKWPRCWGLHAPCKNSSFSPQEDTGLAFGAQCSDVPL